MTAAAAKWRDADAVAWHDLECGSYEADLPLWLELAQRQDGPVLDIGAGTGRVTLALARAGHEVVALDRDAALLSELRARAAALPVEIVCADARAFDLRRRFGLCLVPMQTLQLLGGPAGRERFLRCAREHLEPGALLAAALLPEELEQFDAALGEVPYADELRRGDVTYVSRPTALRVERRAVVLERRRERRPPAPASTATAATSVHRLDRVSAARVAAEAARLGFTAEAPRAVPATSEHVGSEVVVLRA